VAFSEHQDNLSAVKNVLVDGGYTGQPCAAAVRKMLGATVAVAKRNELHTFTVMPKRWVVERSFARLEKCRRLWKNCERKLNTSVQFVTLAFLALLILKIVNRLLATTRFDSAEHLADTIKRYVKVYNQHIPQKALGHSPPLQAMKNWSQKQPSCSKNVPIILRDLTATQLQPLPAAGPDQPHRQGTAGTTPSHQSDWRWGPGSGPAAR